MQQLLTQHEILSNVLFLNKEQYTFGIINTVLCSFCTLRKKLIYIFSMTAFILSLFERIADETSKAYYPAITYHLHHRLAFLDQLMKQARLTMFQSSVSYVIGFRYKFTLFRDKQTHTKYRHSICQLNENKGKRKTNQPCCGIKEKHTVRNAAFQIMLYQ